MEKQEKKRILKIMQGADIAAKLGKKKHWFYQRFWNYDVNGQPATFTAKEKEEVIKIFAEIIEEKAVLLEKMKKGEII